MFWAANEAGASRCMAASVPITFSIIVSTQKRRLAASGLSQIRERNDLGNRPSLTAPKWAKIIENWRCLLG
jgi:hypothetical protein